MSTRTIVTPPVLLLAAFFFQSCGRLAITNTNLFDPVTGTMLPNRTILIEKDRIVSISEFGNSAKVPFFSKVIDGTGKYVIPGLIDAHAHLVFLSDTANLKGEVLLPLYLGNGVTSVRDIGDGIVEQKRVADYAMSHPETSPTVYMCSPLIDGANPYHGSSSVSAAIADSSKVAAFVDSMVSYGVSTLKIYVYAKPEVFRKVIEEGHKHGLTVSAHLPSNVVNTADAIDWGLDVIEHVFGAPEDSVLIAKMVAQGTMLDPTLVVFKNMLLLNDRPEVYQSDDNKYMPVWVQEFWNSYRMTAKWYDIPLSEQTLKSRLEALEKYKATVGKLYRAGVTLLAGTDTPEPYCPPGFSLHDELVLLVESGLPPAAALKCATLNNALALKQANNLGTIEAGKIADMVILNANPLLDIRNTRTIDRVIHRGIVCDPKSFLHKGR